MSVYDRIPNNYQDAAAALGDRYTVDLGYATKLRRHGVDGIALVHHRTAIVEWYEGGETVISPGGYRSTTTKRRIDRALPAPWGLSARDGVWYLYPGAGDPIPYPGDATNADRAVLIPTSDGGHRLALGRTDYARWLDEQFTGWLATKVSTGT